MQTLLGVSRHFNKSRENKRNMKMENLEEATAAVDKLSKEEILELLTHVATVSPEELGHWWATKSEMLMDK